MGTPEENTIACKFHNNFHSANESADTNFLANICDMIVINLQSSIPFNILKEKLNRQT